MKLFIDSANIADIATAISHGLACGCTTNPSLAAKEPPIIGGYPALLRNIVRATNPEFQLHAQPNFPADRSPRETFNILRGATQSNRLICKVPVNFANLALIQQLTRSGVPVNATCVFTAAQAIAAIHAGAKFVSFFWGRMEDAQTHHAVEMAKSLGQPPEAPNYSAASVNYRGGYSNGGSAEGAVRLTRTLIDQSRLSVEIICGSIRTPDAALRAFASGAHIVTTGLSVLQTLAESTLSDQSAAKFSADRDAWDAQCDQLGSGPLGQETPAGTSEEPLRP